MGSYRHTPEMGQISGFGGVYEETCQQLLHNGAAWIANNPDKLDDLRIGGLNTRRPELGQTECDEEHGGVELVAVSDNCKALHKAVLRNASNATSRMFCTVLHRLYLIAATGWDSYERNTIVQKQKA